MNLFESLPASKPKFSRNAGEPSATILCHRDRVTNEEWQEEEKDIEAAKLCWIDYKRRKKHALTHDFKETIRARAQTDREFRQALLREAAGSYLNGHLETGKAVLRDYVNATVGFQALEEKTAIPAKSLMRMLRPNGNPSAANLSSILTALQKTEGVHFEVSLRR